jgi:hypothetical protein
MNFGNLRSVQVCPPQGRQATVVGIHSANGLNIFLVAGMCLGDFELLEVVNVIATNEAIAQKAKPNACTGCGAKQYGKKTGFLRVHIFCFSLES